MLCLVGVTSTYITSAIDGYVPSCIPHLSGCTSISASGREGIGYFLFKATMAPAAIFALVFWILVKEWLIKISSTLTKSAWIIMAIGMIGNVFLVLYVTFLGSEGETYRVLRRSGATMFFLSTIVAHALLTYCLVKLIKNTVLVKWKTVLCAALLVEIIVFVLAKHFVDDHDWIENIVEWHVASILIFMPVITWGLWKQTGFKTEFSINPNATFLSKSD